MLTPLQSRTGLYPRLRCLPSVRLSPPQSASSQSGVGLTARESPSPSCLLRWASLRRSSLLARLDFSTQRSMDRSDACGYPIRHRLFLYLWGVTELHWERVQNILGECHGGYQLCKEHRQRCTPFSATPMYKNLGLQWASTLLALLSLLLSVVPFLFIAYGKNPRTGSRFAQRLASEQEDTSTGSCVIEPKYPLGLFHQDTEIALVARKRHSVGQNGTCLPFQYHL